MYDFSIPIRSYDCIGRQKEESDRLKSLHNLTGTQINSKLKAKTKKHNWLIKESELTVKRTDTIGTFNQQIISRIDIDSKVEFIISFFILA